MLFGAASSSPEPELHALLLAGAFPFVPTSPSPSVRLRGSDEWKNLLRQTAPEHGVHASADTQGPEIPGLSVREPGPQGLNSRSQPVPDGFALFLLNAPQRVDLSPASTQKHTRSLRLHLCMCCLHSTSQGHTQSPCAQGWLHLPPPNASVPQRVRSVCELPFLLLCLSHQVPIIWDHILKKNAGKWEAIAKHQVKRVFSPTEEELKFQARR